MDFNYNLGKNISKEVKIRKQDKKPDEEVLKKDEKSDKTSQILRIPTRRKVTADSTTINAFINRALMEGQVDKPVVTEKEKPQRQAVNEDDNNPFAKADVAEDITVDETANNIFGSVAVNVAEKNTSVVASGGIVADSDSFDDLLIQWNSEAANMSYDAKMNLIGRMISAAERDNRTEEAATWRCYRFILRNNYLKEKYNNYLQQLAGGTSYEDLGWNEQPWEISTSIMCPEDELDFDIFHRQFHFGGYIDPNNFMQYIQPEPNEYPQAYVYCVAMIARLSTKILAMQVKLHDPDIVNNSTLTNKINKDIAYYRQLLQGIVAERNRLAEQLKLGHFEPNGSFHFDVPNAGLVPGLTPPENNPTPIQYDTLQEQFEALEAEYAETFGNVQNPKDDEQQIAKLNELIAFANKMVQKGEEPQEYWQERLRYWQNELAQLQNG